MKNTHWAFVALMALAAPLSGQDHAFSRTSPTQDTVSAVLIRGDTAKFGTLFYVHPDTFLVGMNLMFRDLKLENWSDLGRYISTLERKKCSDVMSAGQKMPLGRIKGTGQMDLSGVWQRECKPGEVLLCDQKLGLCPLSETCWNIAVGRLVPPEWRNVELERGTDPLRGGDSLSVNLTPAPNVLAVPDSVTDRLIEAVERLNRREQVVRVETHGGGTHWYLQKRYILSILGGAALAAGACATLTDDFCGARDRVHVVNNNWVNQSLVPSRRLGGITLFRFGG